MQPEEISTWRVFSCKDKEGMGGEISPEDSPLLSQEHGEGDANRCSGKKGDPPRPRWAHLEPEGGGLMVITSEQLNCFQHLTLM